jgi:hypothetical protein
MFLRWPPRSNPAARALPVNSVRRRFWREGHQMPRLAAGGSIFASVGWARLAPQDHRGRDALKSTTAQFLAIALLATLSGIWFLSDQRNRFLLRGEHFLNSNDQFVGVRLGMDVEAATQRLRAAGFVDDIRDSSYQRYCGRHLLVGDETLIMFTDPSWRHGRVCVVQAEGDVVAMNIIYALFII